MYRYAALFLFLVSPLVTHADPVRYTVTVDFPPLPDIGGTFVFEEPTIQTSEFTVYAADLSSSTNPAFTSLDFRPVYFVTAAQLNFVYAIGSPDTEFHSTFGEPLVSHGEYSSGFVDVKIADANMSATPEPSSLIFLGTGAFPVVAAARRRLRM